MKSTARTHASAVSVYTFATLLACAVFLMSSAPVYATPGVNTPMGSVLCEIVAFVYGNLGRGMATLAVIVVGVGATLGKASWGLAITVAVGIGVIFNATNIMNLLVNSSGGAAVGC